jgi:hypothetical protein
LPNILFGFETLSLTITEEQKLVVFKKRVLQKILGAKEEVTRDWSKLYNDDLHNSYTSPNRIQGINSRRMSWAGHVTCMKERRGAPKVLVGKPKE